jgi:adenine-specific DNA-methyltransferase
MTMKKLTLNDPETSSLDGVAENIRRLKALFPELVTEGPNGAAVNVDVLKALVGDATVTDADEKYGLNWHGKRRARQLALMPSTGTLRPCPEESVDWDTTQNLMIEGDNLEVLKLLQKSYAGKVKLIYIDPPYNTGKDFVYPDDYQDSIKNYLELTGQVEGGRKISTNTEASGRFHTNWLNMMYPRLRAAREMLRSDGVIFISIDDSELGNLRAVCDEVFGGENFVGRVTWERKRKGSHLSPKFVQRTESLLIYSQSNADIRLFGEPAGEEEDQPLVKRTNATKTLTIPAGVVETSMEDGDLEPGLYGSGSSAVELLSPAVIRNGRFSTQLTLRGPFIWTQQNLDEELKEGARLFIRTRNLSLRVLKAAHRQGFKALSSILTQAVGTNEDALSELAKLFDVPEDEVPFDYPKPLGYIQKIVSSATHWDRDAIVIDFFGGSGTTGHAVMAQNALDGGRRRYVLVQLPEPLDPENKDQKVAADFCDKLNKPRNIAELTKERLRRAAKKIKDENPTYTGDLGFRVFKLDSSNIRPWEPDSDNLEQTLLDSMEHIKADRTETDVLYELLLKLGLDLCVPIESRTFADKEVHSVGGGVLMACLAPKIERTEVEALAQGIVDWHKALAPAGDTTCVFRDSAFADDVAKTNMAAILEQHGITNVRSL